MKLSETEVTEKRKSLDNKYRQKLERRKGEGCVLV